MYGKYVKLRNQSKKTDYQVSKDTGITRSTFSDWKSGRSKPKLDKLVILAKYFGVSIEYFLDQEKANDKRGERDITSFRANLGLYLHMEFG